ncbi:polysaccharide biosynthesis/export family protein [Neorhizobium sp. T786]|uniref:polysaccharide biosynthesis/export family protein n=1 Tax=Pseudorhizobium xiangyangii TaxID=2883104 RepID=UPI001CFF915A|nr:polysaccharide biosynthesis/export family protein [Neorhizobium xiangyangii]MCB5204674.1 polysaccharide biosynthesis/export family protein [Neorhizobium xiangyangii]
MIRKRAMRRLAAITVLAGGLGSVFPAFGQNAYTLSAGDTIQVWMAQSEDLQRDVVIGPDGILSLPLAGHLQAQGMTLLELEATLQERLRPYFKDPSLTLMLRPGQEPVVYVVGEVTTPGAFPFRSAMTVLHAVSVAGGIYRAAVLPADQDRSVIVSGQVAEGTQKLRELAARIKRLEAEIEGRTTIIDPGDDAPDPILVQEQTLLEARSRSLATMEEAQRQVDELNERNTKEMEEQVATTNRRLELARDRLKSISNLVQKGGAEASQTNRHEAEIADIEGDLSRMKAALVLNERGTTAETARYRTEIQERQTQLLAELQAARRTYDETSERVADGRRILSIYGTSAMANERRSNQTITFSILRRRDGTTSEIDATEITPIEPGDLVRVRYQSADEAADAQAGTGTGLEKPSSVASRVIPTEGAQR